MTEALNYKKLGPFLNINMTKYCTLRQTRA